MGQRIARIHARRMSAKWGVSEPTNDERGTTGDDLGPPTPSSGRPTTSADVELVYRLLYRKWAVRQCWEMPERLSDGFVRGTYSLQVMPMVDMLTRSSSLPKSHLAMALQPAPDGAVVIHGAAVIPTLGLSCWNKFWVKSRRA